MTIISVDVAVGVAGITLSNGDTGNLFDAAFCGALLDAVQSCSANPAVRCILIRSSGKDFSYGGNLRWLANFGDRVHEAVQEPVRLLNETITCLRSADVPLVVAVQGVAAGGAVGLTACADIVIAADNARFHAAFPGIGLSCDTGTSYFLPRLVGLRRAQQFLLLNQTWRAKEALEAGLVTRVVPLGELGQAAVGIAEALASGPTIAFGEIRRLLCDPASLQWQLTAEAAGIARSSRSQDMRRAVDALLAKRTPTFLGQ